MGILKKVLGNAVNKALGMPDQKFIEFVRANDNGEEWAQREFQRLWHQNDESLIPRIHRARVFIYENAAKQGDRDAIIKYARGLAWSGREEEALSWYMKLINNGDADAMYELSCDYNEFGAFGENEVEQLKWLKKAAEAGHPHAQYRYGSEMFIKGFGKESAFWYQKSAENGDPRGMTKYAEVVYDEIKAIASYLKGIPEYFPGVYDCIEKYNIQTNEDGISKMQELWYVCEGLLVDASDACDTGEDQAEVFRVLSRIYLYCPEEAIKRSPYLGYYYQFVSSYIMHDGDCSGEWWNDFLANIKKEGLNITIADLNEWKNADCAIDAWMQRKGIVE